MEAELDSDARTNVVKSAWRKVGLGGRLNPDCEMWTAAISHFGEGTLLDSSLKAIQLALTAKADELVAERLAAANADMAADSDMAADDSGAAAAAGG
eukprot:785334-Prymnesium_polylepis.1